MPLPAVPLSACWSCSDPRVGKFDKDGNPRDIAPHSPWLVCVGLFLIYTGFWGFYVACNVPIIDPAGIEALFGDTEGRGTLQGETWTATTIYLTADHALGHHL